MSFTKKVQTFLDEAFSKGIIDQSVKQKLQDFSEIYDRKSVGLFMNLVSLFGAAAIILGAILIISHNWNQISNLAKISAYITLLIGFHISAYLLRETRPKISQIIYFIAAGYVLAGIGLIAQIYNLSSKNGEAYLIWFALILPMAILLRNGWIGTMAMLGFYWWININASLNFYNYQNGGHSVVIFAVAIFSSMILLPKTFPPLKNSLNHIKLIGYFLLGLTTLAMGFTHKIFPRDFSQISLHPITIAIIIFNISCLTNNFVRNSINKMRFSSFILLPETIIATLILITLLILPEYKLATSILCWVVWFWASGSMIYVGEMEKSRTIINIGIWCAMIGLVARFIDLVGTMLFTGSMFIIFGAILILIAFFGEKYRKLLINKIFKNHELQK